MRHSMAVVLVIALLLTQGVALTSAKQAPAGAFRPAGSFIEPRVGATATLLQDGRVLVVGGLVYTDESLEDHAFVGTAEVWDPATESFAPAGSLAEPRIGHSATLLPDGRVLIVGGTDRHEFGSWDRANIERAEVWDPATESFHPAGALDDARLGHSTTTLADGAVLVIGGYERSYDFWHPEWSLIDSAEVWDPAAETFIPAGQLREARMGHTATLLEDGDVLVVTGCCDGQVTPLGSAEVWSPETRRFYPAGRLRPVRRDQVAVPLQDGRVLVVGGWNAGMPVVRRTDVWDPQTETFRQAGNLTEARDGGHTATLLPSGKVLVIGGTNLDGEPARAELWRPRSGSYRSAGTLAHGRLNHTATLLPDGRVLVIGGEDMDREIATAEIWEPATRSFRPAGTLAMGRISHDAIPLSGGRVLVIGGEIRDGQPVASAELWEPDE